MERRFEEVMQLLNHYELMKLKRDLESGGIEVQSILDKRIKEEEKKHDIYCMTCSGNIDQEDVNNFTLIFGPDSLKKKATFCAVDCLEYFLKNVKQIKAFQKPKQQEISTK